jgi:endoglucanase
MPLDGNSIILLKNLSESFGPSGFENETASIVRKAGERYAENVTNDKLGSVIFEQHGTNLSPKILLAGHIDEIGFVVTGIDKDSGCLTFNPLGGWFDQVLLGQRVTVRTRRGDVPGVIASTPSHLLTHDEREKVVKIDSMFIDVGAESKESAERDLGIRMGDPIAPSAPFIMFGNNNIAIGKAFDDRVGVFVGLEILKRLKNERIEHSNMVYLAATVQEEVGLRGARSVANIVNPDVAFALEVDIAGDVPGVRRKDAPAKLGKGPSILTYDGSMIPNQALKSFAIDTAERENIPYQLSVSPHGGTDAGKFHTSGEGCPSLVIGVPTRHIHSHSAILNLSDVESTINLVVALVKALDDSMVQSFVRA